MGEKAKPLNVALIHRNSRRCTDKRMVGIWSSPVPEFAWRHFPMHKGFTVDKSEMRSLGYDLIFMEDGKLYGDFVGSGPPVAFYVVDSTLSEGHLIQRREQARQADLVLVDHDELSNLRVGPPVRRLSHCVNHNLFRDYGEAKTVDVSFHCRTKGEPGGRERAALQGRLREISSGEGWAYACGTEYDEAYPRAFNRSKVTVNLSRTPANRPHRIFDAMACGTAVLTNVIPKIPEDHLDEGSDYVEFTSDQEMENRLRDLLWGGYNLWEWVGRSAYHTIQQYHTWPIRAKQLREILSEELGI